MTAMARSFSYQDDRLTWIFGICLVGAVIAFAVCLIELGRAYYRQTNVYLPLLRDLQAARQEWRAFYEEVHQAGADESFFQHELEQRITDAADRNTRNNDYRSARLHWARIALFAVLALTALMGIPYVVDQVRY